jgi:hypothetical protein
MTVLVLGEMDARIGNRGAATMETIRVVDVASTGLEEMESASITVADSGGASGLLPKLAWFSA